MIAAQKIQMPKVCKSQKHSRKIVFEIYWLLTWYPTGQSLKLHHLFRNVTVYIRRLTSGERPPEQDPTDPDFDGYVNGIKRFKTGNGQHFIPNNSPCCDFVRRSKRKQKVRGERELTVSSDMLLRDLKVKVRKYVYNKNRNVPNWPQKRTLLE